MQNAQALPEIRLTPPPASLWGVRMENLTVDLNGIWQFHPAPPANFWQEARGGEWRDIQVPGEWVMQGYEVAQGVAAGYRREFAVPDSWRGKRIKLRCEGIYSDAKIWMNGLAAGAHLGGFTSFELDVTKLVRPGGNAIAISVKSESLADKLAAGIRYATHDLGGIARKIRLFAVPEINIADLYTRTVFSDDFLNADLFAQVKIVNESSIPSSDGMFECVLRDGEREVGVAKAAIGAIQAGAVATLEVKIRAIGVRPWDAEHPHLYELVCSLRSDTSGQWETVTRRIGFRQVDVRGNRLYINNHPVKLRGVNRHEGEPLRGRSPSEGACRRDVELFREMNCNLIRTSHYPPPEELLHACDELGMFVEVEAPFCWAGKNEDPEALAYTIQAEVETVLRDRSHASVILWSLANESAPCGKNFEIAHRDYLKELDPTRPFLFEAQSRLLDQNPPFVDIDALHYPGFAGPEMAAAHPRPIFFGEFAHLNVYNRVENFTDPGLRDIWGLGIAEMWERMLASRGCLGGAIWAGIDDLFLVPNLGPVGYGEWGPLDAWRRPRPEYWHLKKIFSPLRLETESLSRPSPGQPFCLRIVNRQYFSDLYEIRFEWALGSRRGEARTNALPGNAGVLRIPAGDGEAKELEVKAFDARGCWLDAWRIPIGDPHSFPPKRSSGKLTLSRSGGSTFRVAARDSTFEVDAETGTLVSTSLQGKTVSLHGPALMLLPLKKEQDSKVSACIPEGFNPVCAKWQAGKIEAQETADGVEVRIAGTYKEAAGEYLLTFSGDGKLRVEYNFELREEIAPRQIGLVFELPGEFNTLSWRRRAQWSYYPADHIGRPEGEAHAFPSEPCFDFSCEPSHCWAHDCTPGGSNDFRSTKFNVFEAALLNQDRLGLRILSDGYQHVRSWIDDNAARLLVADFSNEGAANFFNEHALPRPILRSGGLVRGGVTIAFAPQPDL